MQGQIFMPVHFFPCQVTTLACNNPNAQAIFLAQQGRIPCHVIAHENYPDRSAYERTIINALKTSLKKTKVIVLAVYMRILFPVFFCEIKKENPQVVLVN